MTNEKLIPLVCAKPELWDQSNKHYPSKEMKQRAWQFIGEQLNLTGNEAKIRWTNLRDLFRRELKKTVNMAKMTGDPEAYVPRWRHFKSMLFLRDQIVKDCEDLELPSLVFDDSKLAMQPLKDECNEMEDEFYGEYSSNDSPNFIDISEMPQSSSRKRGSKNCNGYGDYNNYQTFSKRQHVPENPVYVDAVETYQAPQSEFNNDMDEDYHFVMSILGSVRRIRPDRKTSFKLKVLQLIMEEENCLLAK